MQTTYGRSFPNNLALIQQRNHSRITVLFFASLTSLNEEHFRFVTKRWTPSRFDAWHQIADRYSSTVDSIHRTKCTMGKYATDEAVVRRMIRLTYAQQMWRHFVVGQIFQAFDFEIKPREGPFKVFCQQTHVVNNKILLNIYKPYKLAMALIELHHLIPMKWKLKFFYTLGKWNAFQSHQTSSSYHVIMGIN